MAELRSRSAALLRFQDQIKSTSEYQKAREEAHNEPIPIVAALSTPVAISVKAETKEAKSICQVILKTIEIIGIVAVITYAILTFFIWKEMQITSDAALDSANQARRSLGISQRAIAQTRDQFRQDERPYITMAPAGA